jgi:hypothetical protein
VGRLVGDGREVGEPRLHGGSAQIFGEGVGEILLPLGEHALHRFELREPPLDRPGASAAEGRAEVGDGVRDAA